MAELQKDRLYVAIDPSFSGMGLSVVKGEGGIVHWEFSAEGSLKDPNNLGRSMRVLVDSLAFSLESLVQTRMLEGIPYPITVIIETPPPRAMFSAGLYYLVGAIVCYLVRTFDNVEIYGTSAMTIKSILGSRKATKKDSVNYANHLKELYGLGYQVTSHNIADSFILLVYLFQTVLGIEVIKDGNEAKKFRKPQFSRII